MPAGRTSGGTLCSPSRAWTSVSAFAVPRFPQVDTHTHPCPVIHAVPSHLLPCHPLVLQDPSIAPRCACVFMSIFHSTRTAYAGSLPVASLHACFLCYFPSYLAHTHLFATLYFLPVTFHYWPCCFPTFALVVPWVWRVLYTAYYPVS